MTRVKVTDNFYLDELVCPEIYAARGAKAIALLDIRIVSGLQWLRDTLDRPIVVNDWIHRGGQCSESGLRSFNTGTGAKWSQHKFGRAFDVKVEGMRPADVREHILKHQDYLVQQGWITCLEDTSYTPTWLHMDCRYTGKNRIVIVRP